MKKHLVDIERFYQHLGDRPFISDVAIEYEKRLVKNREKLFTFIKHDGVPWNNNNAEHAVKHFAYYRVIVDGKVTEAPLRDYLVLLTIYQTCKYRGVSFLKFLLSGEKDIETYRDSERPKSGRMSLQVYPKGCSSFCRTKRKA